MKCIRFGTLTFVWALGCAHGPTPSPSSGPFAAAVPVVRPTYALPGGPTFDATRIAAYGGQHGAIYQHIDASLDAHTAAIQRWLRQRSISAQNDGVREMATMVRDDLKAIGFQEAELVETDGHPGVWGYYHAGAPKTLLVYMMYDVQPVNEADWRSPPFEARIIDHDLGRVIMARGATNQKGPQRAFLNAIESIVAVDGTLPVNLMVTVEGEEELGSPHYPQIIDRYEQRLRSAHGVIFPFNSQGADGSASLILGVKGMLYLEAEATGGEHGGPSTAEIHGSYKAIVDSPVWRLVNGLSSMVSDDGNTILIDGYYDGVRPPTEEEAALIRGLARQDRDALYQKALSVAQWIDGKTGVEAIKELIYTPTLNIDGIYGGYTGEGVKTILPHKATAKVDSRLPVGIDPDAALAKIRAHLQKHGYDDIKLRKLSGYPASQTSVTSPLVQAVLGVFNKYGHVPTVNPRIAGSAPFYQFTKRLGLPMIPAGLGYGTGAHAPNEIMVVTPRPASKVAGLAEIEKAYVDILFALARAE